jgi:hypothetical protein
MGYTTEFEGRFELDRPMSEETAAALAAFADERHGGNTEPFEGMPGFWCDWVPTADRRGIEWNGAEKFYRYTEWLGLIIARFLAPAGLVLNGSVRWRGEDFDDVGTLTVIDNDVEAHPGVLR